MAMEHYLIRATIIPEIVKMIEKEYHLPEREALKERRLLWRMMRQDYTGSLRCLSLVYTGRKRKKIVMGGHYETAYFFGVAAYERRRL